MKAKHVAVLVLVISPGIMVAVAYFVSCQNAGRMLSASNFFEGVVWRTTNCGGNSAAAAVCRQLVLYPKFDASEHNGVGSFASLSGEDLTNATKLTDSHWTSGAKYLLRNGEVKMGQNTHELIVICDTAYDNVPQPNFWNLHSRTPGHAVGYSGGTTGWLTPEEFVRLDKSGFAEAKMLLGHTNAPHE